MECTLTIYPTSMMNGLKKKIGRENPKKMAGTSVKGIVKTQLEVLEVENASLCTHRYSIHCALTVEFTSLK